MSERVENEKAKKHPTITGTSNHLLPVKPSEVNDDPAQILDVVTLSEQEKEHCGVEIDVASFVYEPASFSVGTDVLDQLLADSADEFALPSKESDTHEHD